MRLCVCSHMNKNNAERGKTRLVYNTAKSKIVKWTHACHIALADFH